MKNNKMKHSSCRGRTFLPTLPILLFVMSFPCVISTYVGHRCDNSSTFTNASAYSTNLNLVIQDLFVNGPKSSGFNISSRGQSPNQVYGLLQCTGNISTVKCSNCVMEANNSIHDLCANDIGAQIWLDDCFMRYHNSNFISILDTTGFKLRNTMDINSSRDSFISTTASLLSNLSEKAYIPANKGFATGSASYSASGKVYGFVQCWRDLSIQDCRKCLVAVRGNLSNCCAKNEGAQFLSRSCKARYEIYPIFDTAQPPTPSSEGFTPRPNSTRGNKSSKILPIILGFLAGIILVFLVCLIVFRKKVRSAIFWRQVDSATIDKETQGYPSKSGLMEDKKFVYNFEVLEEATENFHDNNKLGEGGFGLVYKGTTRDGNEIAVKKISAKSVEGKINFMNEVKLVANVQHRNLARLLGCCIEGDERFLIYEYFPNKSLDAYIFDQGKRRELDWQKRYNIILGIARGLLYLHQESLLQIIHRDIKTNNILLDHKFDPKIADFGLAKLFPEDKTHIHTRVAGTCGYIAPEYAMQGQLSVKVDVYSFGVVLLEIVSGRKNNDNRLPYDMQHLVEWAWNLFEGGNAGNMVDSEASGVSEEQVLRCIHVGLLCVQANAALRPVMSDVITMISGSSVTLPNPSKPAFVSTGETYTLKPESNSQISDTTTSSLSGINPSVVSKVEAR